MEVIKNISEKMDDAKWWVSEPMLIGSAASLAFASMAFIGDCIAYFGADASSLDTPHFSAVYLKMFGDGLSVIGNGAWAIANVSVVLKVQSFVLNYLVAFTVAGGVFTGLSAVMHYYKSFVKMDALQDRVQQQLERAVRVGDFVKEREISAYLLGRNFEVAGGAFTFTLAVITVAGALGGAVFSNSVIITIVASGVILFCASNALNYIFDFKGIERKYFPLDGSAI